MVRDGSRAILTNASSRALRKCLGAYLSLGERIWRHFPESLRANALGLAYGRHLLALVRLRASRSQCFTTYFMRNPAELELVRRLLDKKPPGSTLNICVLACSKGAEVYCVLWTVHSARPDLKIRMYAVDVSQKILTFAQQGVYSLSSRPDVSPEGSGAVSDGDVLRNTGLDQIAPIFWRMSDTQLEAMFEVQGDHARVRPWLKEGISWLCADARDPRLPDILGAQDIVLANRFLCHMEPVTADSCLRNIGRLVKPGGFLFVSGIDLDVRTKVAIGMGWRPVADLIREIHEGDPSLRRGWPLEYWGLEPFSDNRSDWKIRYASVFQIGEAPGTYQKPTALRGHGGRRNDHH